MGWVGTVLRLRLPGPGVISTSDVEVKVGAVVEPLVGTECDTAGCRAPHDDTTPISSRHFYLAEELRSALWVPNWSSTAVTCDIAGSGSPGLISGQPFEICPCGRFEQFEERARPRHWQSRSPR
jgi:hypothetical protein